MASELKRSMTYLDDKERQGFFKDFHKMVRRSVSNDQFNEFSRLKTDQERVAFMLKVPSTHDINIKTFYKGKSEREALEKKEAGNKCFIHKDNLDALRLYSQAVIKAPVPSEENADPKKMTLYAICLANRSAALFQLEEFYYCIRDIEEALEHHYPKELKYKLYKRKGRMLVTFKRHIDARDSYRQAIKWLDWAKMDRESRNKQHTDIQKWLRLFEGAKVCKNAPWPLLELAPKVPELAGMPSEKFPSLSQKLSVKHENKCGRYIEAAEDIHTGDILVTEKPYAAVLLYEAYGTHCQNCFAITKSPIPCKMCSGVLFCSVSCRDQAFFHQIECPILDLLHGSGMSINCFLAFRLLTQTPLSYFINIKDTLIDENPKDILDTEDTYHSSEFLRVFNLVRHESDRTSEDYFHRTVMAVFMMKTLKKTKYFADFCHGTVQSVSETEAFVGGLLLRFLQIIQFNAHEVSEFHLKRPKSIKDAENESIGAAIYPTVALFNHSCQPALVRYFSGNRMILKAVRPLAKGEMVPENYGPTFSAKDQSERRVELNDRYWFDCSCQPCLEKWPTFNRMDNSVLKFKCRKCKTPFKVEADTTTPFFVCSQCDISNSILSALKNLQNTEQTFKAACNEMDKFNLIKAESLLIENINQLDSCLYPPYRDYHLTQEALMKCCLCQGNKKIMIDDIKEIKKKMNNRA